MRGNAADDSKINTILRLLRAVESVNEGISVRDTQIVSLLLAIHRPSRMGRLLEINTGEGKTLIIQLICGYYALRGKKVDVVTSGNTLAQRDSRAGARFFAKLGLTVGFVADNNEPETYERDVLFGTVHAFCSDRLRKYASGKDVVGDRGADLLVVDEVDSMLIDKPQIKTIISQPSCFKDETAKMFRMIWFNLREVLLLHEREGVEPDLGKLKADLRSDIQRKVGAFADKKVREFLHKNMDTWVDNAVKALLSMRRNVDYVISADREVKIIDLDTGETQAGMKWSDGLHYFIELKHSIIPRTITSSSFFEHHVNFFLNYGSDLVGLTGTLGSSVCRDFLREIYGVNCVSVPTFKQKKFLELSPCVCRDKSAWFMQLLREVIRVRKRRRPSLVLFENIQTAQEFGGMLRNNNFRFRDYTRSDLQSPEHAGHRLGPDDIVLSTNLAGRGTDFQLRPEVVAAGGLHVVVTFVASNIRVEKQAFGRAARKGEFGTGRLLLNMQNDVWLRSLMFNRSFGLKVGAG